MNLDLITGYLPLDKSWMIRMGVLDTLHGSRQSIDFLAKQYASLNDDLRSLLKALIAWNDKEPIDVGESGTLYRFLKFASWKLGRDDTFVLHGTLRNRKICDNPEIVNWSLEKLLNLDKYNMEPHKTSQWASASVLMGNTERPQEIPFKLKVTYDAVDHWKWKKHKNEPWEPRRDETITAQAIAFLRNMDGRGMNFVPKQAEDYCFARAFGIMDAKEGEKIWPSLRNHESDRIIEMEKAIGEAEERKPVTSRDHRVIHAVVMSYKVDGIEIKAKYPDAVKKSWPQFWDFIESSPRIAKYMKFS